MTRRRRTRPCAFIEHVVAGRAAAIRGADRKELAATAVLAVPLAEVSAKVRKDPPKDDEPDYECQSGRGCCRSRSPRRRRSRPSGSTRRCPTRARHRLAPPPAGR
jgi:hypothetical protein